MSVQYPLDLLAPIWKLTLPVNGAQEVLIGGKPDLLTYTDAWCHLNAARTGIVFRANTDGSTTSNSKNPRSELREMAADGKTLAAWSSTVDRHALRVRCAVTALPLGSKPHVVVAQIHSSSDDLTVFRVEGNVTGDRSLAQLWITNENTTHGHLVTNAYRLGDVLDLGFQVEAGVISYTYNGQPVNYTKKKSGKGWYFKTGCYNQAGGIVTRLPDGSPDYAEVVLYGVAVTHGAQTWGSVPFGEGETPPTPPDPKGAVITQLRQARAALDTALTLLGAA